jgi:hypothetical protein
MTNPQTAAPGVAVEATIAELMALVDEHGEHRWSTGWEEHCNIKAAAQLFDKKAVAAREKIESALRTALLAGAAGGQSEPVAWRRQEGNFRVYYEAKAWDDLEPLYTAPPAPVVAQEVTVRAAIQNLMSIGANSGVGEGKFASEWLAAVETIRELVFSFPDEPGVRVQEIQLTPDQRRLLTSTATHISGFAASRQGTGALPAPTVLRFNGDTASASAIASWANSFPELDEGEPNASYITTDGSDVVDDLLLAVDNENERLLVGDYVTREGDKFLILRAATQPSAAPAEPTATDFICHLIDSHEGETVAEESLQQWLAEVLRDPKYGQLIARDADDEPECENCNQLARALREATEAPSFMGEPVRRLSSSSNWIWGHILSGGKYTLLGTATVQSATALLHLDKVSIYQGKDGEIWARPVAEFDEHFKRLRPLAAPPPGEVQVDAARKDALRFRFIVDALLNPSGPNAKAMVSGKVPTTAAEVVAIVDFAIASHQAGMKSGPPAFLDQALNEGDGSYKP